MGYEVTSHDVFISYAMEDKPSADLACASLESEDIKCWIAPRDVVPGRPWGESIIKAIKQSKVMVVIFSSNANKSPYIPREVNHAVETGLSVITVRIENVEPADALELYLDVIHWLDAIDPPLEKQLRRLNENVKQLLQLPPGPPIPPPLPRPRPIPKWALWLGTGLLAAVSMIFVWSIVRPDSDPVAVVSNSSPSPSPTSSSNNPPATLPNINTNANSATSPSSPPATVNSSSPSLPDDTDSRIAEAARVLGDANSQANVIEHVRAINALESLGAKSLKHHSEVVNILAIYLRNNAKWQGGTNRSDKPAPDTIQAAITALGRRKWTYKNGEDQPLELSGLDLRGVVFRIEGMRANFDGARLVRTHLNEAILMETDFRFANLTGAFMKGVDVNGTDFCDAILAPAEAVESEMRIARNRNKKCEP